MEFGLLGPLAVRRGDTVVPVQPGKQRVVLAALLLNANRVVPLEDLAEVLWGAAPPPSARVTVQNYVVRLRKALADEAHARITTQPRGYVIRVAAGELDLIQFEVLLGGARQAAGSGSWDTAAAQAGAALALWRGEPLADVQSEVLGLREVPRLADLHLQALEIRIDGDLHLGRHAELTGELRHLAGAHPLREHLRALLMLALYRDGRQAEALAAYQAARRVLLEELGTEPGPELRSLHQQILAADTVLDLPGPRWPARGAGRAVPQELPAGVRHFTGRAGELAALTGQGAATLPVPRQLPPVAADFTGRTAELRTLTRMLEDVGAGAPGTVVISAIGGAAGVGKTALALRWAHQIAGRFPDGQLHVNLRGFDPSGTPATPAQVIRGFLDALGVPPERIPPLPDAQAGLYRSLLADRRMLILLDNARDEQQVRPLLSASPGSLVLVTSRNQMSGLAAAYGARLLSLDILRHGEAVQLLTARLGNARAAAEPEVVAEIAGRCACLPLALTVAAARAAARPGFPLAALAAELRDEAGRLDALDIGDPAASVRTAFSWSYHRLSSEAARMFRLLGLHPGPDISIPAAASLAGTGEPDARLLLRDLSRAHLITEHALGRYAIHDLLRAYAADQARTTDSEPVRTAAIGRVLDHYLHTARGAALLLMPSHEPVSLAPPSPGTTPEQPAHHRHALVWFEAEHHVLLAAVALSESSGFDVHGWQIPWAMMPFLRARGHYQEWAAVQRTALAAATRLGDIAAQAISGRLLANACDSLAHCDQARGYYMTSLQMYRRLGNRLGEAKVHQNLAFLSEFEGRYTDALGHSEQALLLYRAIGDKAGEVDTLNAVGWCHGLLGDYQQVREFCKQALTLNAEVGDHRLGAGIWDSLGYAEHHLGNPSEAVACYQRAISIVREFGDRYLETICLTHIGDIHHDAGELPQAREAWLQALAILDDLCHPDADRVRAKLKGTLGSPERGPL